MRARGRVCCTAGIDVKPVRFSLTKSLEGRKREASVNSTAVGYNIPLSTSISCVVENNIETNLPSENAIGNKKKKVSLTWGEGKIESDADDWGDRSVVKWKTPVNQ